MPISKYLSSDQIVFQMKAKDKNQAIEQIIGTLKPKLPEDVYQHIYESVFERESVMSTGVGKGIAIPHAKIRDLDQTFLAVATLSKPIDFQSIDGEPVDIMVLVVGPTSEGREHIKILSQISKLMNKDYFRRDLKNCTDPDELVAIFRNEEDQLA